jgi:oligo-1,6-glucosidase
LDALIAGLHERDMKIVMDLVVNHTSDEHSWFVQSRSDRGSPQRDWYWWRPAREGFEPGSPGAEPNNWGAIFGGSAWEYDPASGEYYLHVFSPKQPDLNWENPEVRRAVYEMMRWWVDRGVDGFRMDVINLISKDPALPDGPVSHGRWGNGRAYYESGPRIHEFLAEMHREALAGHHLITVGEMPGATVEQARLFTDPARAEVDMVFTFEHVTLDYGGSKWDLQPLRLPDLKANLASWQIGLAETGWNSLYWNNHDQPRVVSRFGSDGEHRVASAKTLGTILHLHRGTPYIYQGEELGMTNFGFTAIDQYRDIEALGAYAEGLAVGIDPEVLLAALAARSRDNARTPMQWTADDKAGFTTGTPWLPVAPNHDLINAAAAVADPESVFHHYRKLIDLRHHDRTVVYGDYHPVQLDHDKLFAFTRSLDADTLLVLGAFADHDLPVELPDHAWVDTAELVLGTHPGPIAGPVSGTLTLRPWESRIYRRRLSPANP